MDETSIMHGRQSDHKANTLMQTNSGIKRGRPQERCTDRIEGDLTQAKIITHGITTG